MASTKRYQLAVITGASAGLGAGLARALAPHCEHMLLVARRATLLHQLASDLTCQAHVLAADVGSGREYCEALRARLASLPPCDLAVLNAGMSVHVPLGDPQLEHTQKLYSVNLFGAIATLDVVLPTMMTQQRGHIVGIASVAAYRGLPGAAAYCSSKSALWRFLESIRCDLARSPIRVTTLHPGFVDTAMTQKNRFPMPFMIDVPKAAALMTRAILRGRRHYAFPLAYRWLFRGLRLLPDFLFFRLFQIAPRRK